MEGPNTSSYFAYKMQQAWEAFEEARWLLADDAELKYVVNSLYYVYYYPVLALLYVAGSRPAMQSVAIALFEKTFSGSGFIDNRFFPLIGKAFDLKPKCTDTAPKSTDRADVEAMLRDAYEFYHAVEAAAPRVIRRSAVGADWRT